MKKIIALCLTLTFVLSSCSTFKKWAGFEKNAPDETKIETRNPLVLPPDFDELPD